MKGNHGCARTPKNHKTIRVPLRLQRLDTYLQEIFWQVNILYILYTKNNFNTCAIKIKDLHN